MAKPSRSFTVAEAREKFIAKLRSAGVKGAGSPLTAKTPAAKRQVYEEAIAQLIGAGLAATIPAGRTTKYFLSEFAPGATAAAAKIERMAAGKHPALLAITDFKKGLSTLEKGFVTEAVQQLESASHLVRLVRGKAFVFAHAGSLRAMLEHAPREVRTSGIDEGRVREAYRVLAERTGFPAVAISGLQRESDAELSELQAWLLSERQEGRAHFGLGDWSLADETTRAGAVEVRGERHLLVRLEG